MFWKIDYMETDIDGKTIEIKQVKYPLIINEQDFERDNYANALKGVNIRNEYMKKQLS